ncbi:hypothetical protein AMECASPLE_031048 [Ameca splendens]|uniref:Uncharacterized protein n=1 Tax=Ameca splendens TaxID=208324 RepID=A0ABV0YTS3_9TELE
MYYYYYYYFYSGVQQRANGPTRFYVRLEFIGLFYLSSVVFVYQYIAILLTHNSLMISAAHHLSSNRMFLTRVFFRSTVILTATADPSCPQPAGIYNKSLKKLL